MIKDNFEIEIGFEKRKFKSNLICVRPNEILESTSEVEVLNSEEFGSYKILEAHGKFELKLFLGSIW